MAARLAVVALLLTGLAFSFKISDQFSRIWLTVTVAASAALIWALRGVAAALIRRAAKTGVLTRTVAVIGAGGQAERLLARLANAEAPWTRVTGVFDDRSTRIAADVGGVPLRGTMDDLIAAIRRHEIDDVVITLPWSAEDRIVSIIARLRMLPVHLYLGDDLIGYHVGIRHRAFAAGVSIHEVVRAPLAGWNGFVKALEDKVLVFLALLFFIPLMGLIAAAIKLDSRGPVLFRQMRHGFNNELIEVFKFRTMHHTMRDENGETLTKKGDLRVTRVGRILRCTSLDELPQLFNVWNGTMSMVGPRPHPTRAKAGQRLYDEVVLEYAARHRVKPGITGWAQVNGWRGDTDSEEKIERRVEHDLYYIENWSLWLDVRILFATILLGWVHKNAY
jgi:Undecaprenyl-phosphate glucose phosphotransferase